VVARRHDVHADIELLVDALHHLLVGRPRRHGHDLALEVLVGADAGATLDHELGAGHEDQRREGDLLLALDIVGGRSAFEIDGAVRQQRDARRGRYRVELDRELVELEFLFDDGNQDVD